MKHFPLTAFAFLHSFVPSLPSLFHLNSNPSSQLSSFLAFPLVVVSIIREILNSSVITFFLLSAATLELQLFGSSKSLRGLSIYHSDADFPSAFPPSPTVTRDVFKYFQLCARRFAFASKSGWLEVLNYQDALYFYAHDIKLFSLVLRSTLIFCLSCHCFSLTLRIHPCRPLLLHGGEQKCW